MIENLGLWGVDGLGNKCFYVSKIVWALKYFLWGKV